MAHLHKYQRSARPSGAAAPGDGSPVCTQVMFQPATWQWTCLWRSPPIRAVTDDTRSLIQSIDADGVYDERGAGRRSSPSARTSRISACRRCVLERSGDKSRPIGPAVGDGDLMRSKTYPHVPDRPWSLGLIFKLSGLTSPLRQLRAVGDRGSLPGDRAAARRLLALARAVDGGSHRLGQALPQPNGRARGDRGQARGRAGRLRRNVSSELRAAASGCARQPSRTPGHGSTRPRRIA